MSKDLVLENRADNIYDDVQSWTADNAGKDKEATEPQTSTMLSIENKVLSREFSRTKKIVYCATGVSIGIIAIVTLITVAMTKRHSDTNDEVIPGGPKLWICTLAGTETSKESCEDLGCIYNETAIAENQQFPECFYPTTNFGYYVESIDSNGILQLVWRSKLMHPTQISQVAVQVVEYSNEMFRVVIKDPKHKRYEVPIDIEPAGAADFSSKLYDVQTSGIGEKFWVHVIRRATNESLFDTRNTTLVFLDQFLEITSMLPSNRFYGLPERGAPFARSMNYVKMPLFAHDNFPSPIGQNINLYSSQPFYMVVESNGDAHGVMVYNSNAMEVYLTPAPSVTLRALGGILDIYFFLGPTPISVTKQLTDVIGKPFLPPYWSIGFHLCRYGYKSTKDTKATFYRNWEKGLPIDVQWQDIDYMDKKLIFTIDDVQFSGLKEFVKDDVQAKGVKYVIIVDPAVGYKTDFDVYERGHFEDVYIKNITGQEIIGKVWPGDTVFPDFTNQKTHAWWKSEMIAFHDHLPYDGIWLDMNEPANFDADGTHGSIYGCQDNEINNPPYKPNTAGERMYFKTLCLDAKQSWGIQRDLHNIYGLTETKATFDALKARNTTQKPFIISRSTFLGSGKYGGHWLGDNESNWKHLRQSIIGILDFNLIGIPMTGADIGGFFGDVTEELSIRWHQLGAWYPFCRNHNFEGSKDQDPATFDSPTFAKIKRAIEVRYELTPYWYTQFYKSHISGEPIMRATFQNFPMDVTLFHKDFDNVYTQFMIGESILVAPVTTENTTKTKVYLPVSTTWYKHINGTYSEQPAGEHNIDIPYTELPYFIKAGVILFMHMEGQTTALRRASPYKIVVFPNLKKEAKGLLYIDRDEYDPLEYAVVKIDYTSNSLSFSAISYNKFSLPESNSGKYGDILVLGVKKQIKSLNFLERNDSIDFEYSKDSNELMIRAENIDKTVLDSFTIEIKFD